MTTSDRFLSTINSLMTQQNVNPSGLARATGMSDTHVDGILKGKTGITLKTIVRFAKVFGVEPYELLR
jgi:plasmid maintenance system antidote protein VapI